MYRRDQPIPIATYYVVAWAQAQRSGGFYEDGYERITEYKPAGAIFPGLRSRGKRLTKAESQIRRSRRTMQAESRKANRTYQESRLPLEARHTVQARQKGVRPQGSELRKYPYKRMGTKTSKSNLHAC